MQESRGEPRSGGSCATDIDPGCTHGLHQASLPTYLQPLRGNKEMVFGEWRAPAGDQLSQGNDISPLPKATATFLYSYSLGFQEQLLPSH